MTSLQKVLLNAALLATGASATNLFVASTNGNLTTLSLTNSARIPVALSGVWAGFFGAEGGNKGIATVHYNRSAYSIIGISDDGQLNGPLQSSFPTITKPGPITARQDLSYLHQVQTDPTGKFLVMNDLGGDMVRIFTFDAETLAPVTEVSQLLTDPAVGPRHGRFRTAESGKMYYFFVGELSQNVYSYEVTYTDVGMSWTKVFEVPALGVGNERAPQTAPASGLELTPDNKFVIVSNRDISFQAKKGPTDTLSTFSINVDGTLELIQLAPSGGWSPRQFSLNKKGNLLAVGHQNNFTVIVWERDLESGKILGQRASIKLSTAVVATIWDE
ncbi:hypothetical protein ONS95_002038 [Cadophora gregata]|uniref:uncharacterized protein n=1 Tax=Cadophora gregata TaxID=51156 RepID=UPI0026DD1AE2|nr:uncharacterized protein ONS95_002038 [Cadophora gregata]KAK0111694.1 hypothetical protein ONS95_002038 [Cadophora gregata]